MQYLIKYVEPRMALIYSKEVEANSKKAALQKMGKKLKYVEAIYLKLK